MNYETLARLLMATLPNAEGRPPYSGEQAYFKANPHVGGMATEDGRVILNPHSALSPEQKRAVAQNEHFRLMLNQTPAFPVTKHQQFAGPYAYDPAATRQTIAARVASGDPSAKATPEQIDWVRRFLMGQR